MFIVSVSGNLTGNFFIEETYSGYFLPIDAVLPDGVKIIAKDATRMVVSGLSDGDKVVVK